MNIRKLLIIIYISLISNLCLSETPLNNKAVQFQIDNIKSQIQEIKSFDETRFNSAVQLANQSSSIASQSSSNISNVLTTFSISFSISFAILTVIAGVWLTLYMNKKSKQADKAILRFNQLKEDLEMFIKTNQSKLYNKFIEADTKDMLQRLLTDPVNISNVFNILAVREIVGFENWDVLKKSFIQYNEIYPTSINGVIIAQYASLIMQHYPEKLVDTDEDKVIELIYKYRLACKTCGFFVKEIIKLINDFSNANNKKLLEILIDSIVLGQAFLNHYLFVKQFKEDVVPILKEAVTKNNNLKLVVTERKTGLNAINIPIIPNTINAITTQKQILDSISN